MLSLMRKTGETIYGGRHLKQDDLAGTADHIITVTKIVDNIHDRFAIFTISDDDDTYDIRLDSDESYAKLGGGVTLHLAAVRAYPNGGKDELGVRIAIDAPDDYRIVRDNAIRKV